MNQIAQIKKAFEAMNKKSTPKILKKRNAPTKSCSECGCQIHARASKCDCGYQFYTPKKKQQEIDAANWRDLNKGDIIKCVSGHGPYFVGRNKPDERLMLGFKGLFEIIEIYDEGPRACGITGYQVSKHGHRKSNYREYIYMGEVHYDKNLSRYNEPHKIRVIKKNG